MTFLSWGSTVSSSESTTVQLNLGTVTFSVNHVFNCPVQGLFPLYFFKFKLVYFSYICAYVNYA